jgi:uncharacterized membrane protein SpoIIM required for sporulation
MNLERFQADRAAEWDELQGLLERVGRRRSPLPAAGVLRVGELYRASVADLAYARRRFAGDPIVERLERLVARARQVVYGERESRHALRDYLLHGYWRAIRARPGLLGIVLVAMVASTVLPALWAVTDPGAAVGLIPAAYRGAANPHVHNLPTGAANAAALASSIYTNNIQVAFLCFAGGLLFGLGTLYVLVYNGLLLGTLAGLSLQAGTFDVFVRYVLPHGVLELSCFAVAGLSGLRLGAALVDPGPLPRGEALRRAARPAVALVLGTAPWLVLAGIVEGSVTPSGLSVGAALAVGLGLGVLFWGLVLVRGGPATAAGAPSR